MIDAHVTGIPKGAGEHGPDVAVPVLTYLLGSKRREAPVLARGEERVRRSSAVHAGEERGWGPARVEAVWVNTDRQVCIEADLPAGSGELLGRGPLAIEVIAE